MPDSHPHLPALRPGWINERIGLMLKGTPRLDALRLIIRECTAQVDVTERRYLIAQEKLKSATELFDREAGNA